MIIAKFSRINVKFFFDWEIGFWILKSNFGQSRKSKIVVQSTEEIYSKRKIKSQNSYLNIKGEFSNKSESVSCVL